MGKDECKPVSVSRRIEAPESVIFKLLANPDRHPEFDGSEMLRTGASNEVIGTVGDVFVTKMFFAAMGDYEMHSRLVVFDALTWPFHHDRESGGVVLEYASEGRVVASGAAHANRYISVLTTVDRKATSWRDYLDPIAVFDAVGWPPRG
jgi:hypothetical protein